MRPAALTMAVLLGIATLGGAAQAQATPAVSATIVIETGAVHVGGKRHHRFHRGPTSHWHKGLANHHKRWQVRSTKHRHKAFVRHQSRWQGGRHHRPAFVGKRFHGAPVVIVKPAPRRWLGHRHLPPRPLIRNGSFARGHHHW
jgi:hypothetical protein